MCLALTCSDSSSLMFVRPSIVALTVDRIFSWVLIVGIRSQTWNKHSGVYWSDKPTNLQILICLRWKRADDICATDLQQVCANPFVGALLGYLFSQPRDLIGGLGDVLGTLNKGTFISAASTHQARHLCHKQGHALRCSNDVITLIAQGL